MVLPRRPGGDFRTQSCPPKLIRVPFEAKVAHSDDGWCDLGVDLQVETAEEFGHPLIDVSGMSLRDLDEIGETSLAQTLRHVLDDDEIGPVAGFTSKA
jgi:FXSXX-COOH protein